MKRTIHEWWYFLTQGIKNTIYWFPIIWKDRDWDYAYMERLLLHKLKGMYKRFSNPEKTYVYWTYESSAKYLQALKICIMILERKESSFMYTCNCSVEYSIAIEERDQKVLYSLMAKYSEGWWD